MNSLEKKALKRASELLKQFDTYEIYKAINNSIATIEDKELNRNIIDSYQNAMSREAKKISEAKSWIDEVLNNE
ncbi:hypothetical protein [Bacteroides nordii]|jgi:hypothetical protein|uniref:hypothetical protein n=1 Tax=Bacteroides nordii TaxID=291645 RepID=UPI00189A3625|nr:hypothetical protein [Bacteroides nordii]